jgi:predicted nucleic acid-binding protein
MNRVCIDASFLLRLLTVQESNSIYEKLWNQWQENGTELVAPTLIFYEITNGLYRYIRAEELTENEGENLLELALSFPINL